MSECSAVVRLQVVHSEMCIRDSLLTRRHDLLIIYAIFYHLLDYYTVKNVNMQVEKGEKRADVYKRQALYTPSANIFLKLFFTAATSS